MSEIGTKSAQTRAQLGGIVDLEGGGFFPTLDWVEGDLASPGSASSGRDRD
ncbi:MAG TPA: hypothetical protein VLJ76_03365 [Gaiellaceae bacterium]|nr:hypothetical protein [Gaiellaceae bacterium]